MSGIGANLPPHLLAKRKRKQEQEAENAPSTDSGAKKPQSPDAAEKRRRVVGPAMPPAPLDERPTELANAAGESSSDNDDGFGPALPSNDNATTHHSENDTGATPNEGAQAPGKPKRDDWMTMAPEQDGLAARMDPSKFKARGFNTTKGAKAPSEKGGDGSAWHETPEQKRKRLADEMMGITAPSAVASVSTSAKDMKRKEKDEAAARKIWEHNEKNRGPTLMEQHKVRKPDEAEDDPSKRAFDREKDIGSGIVGRAERKDFLNKAAGFSSKFSGGSYL